ncbi:concanavalin A-like lectin/glucanase domain-containing protein [Geopyxis carbonaria]|nr:concanavalin A-like lectin/glucanase domain-containing protein [Geopyxis carbonaria]
MSRNTRRVPHTTDTASLFAALPDWRVQNWEAPSDHPTGVLAKKNEVANVWIQNGELHLQQTGYGHGSGRAVRVAELHSRQSDILHGSFSMVYKVVRQPGAVGGSDDTVETDVEILTKDADGSSIHYTNHPAYDTQSNRTIPGASFQHGLRKPWEAHQEHRFDWAAHATRFYQDGRLDREIRTNVPNKSGKIMINLWANNGSWSGAPSDKDVVMSIRQVNLCFNTTASDAGHDREFARTCGAAGGFYNDSAICSPDANGAPSWCFLDDIWSHA